MAGRKDNESRGPDSAPPDDLEGERAGPGSHPSPGPTGTGGRAQKNERRRIVRTTGWATLVFAGVVIVILLAYHLLHFLIIVFIAIVVAASIYPAASWLERHKVPRVLAILIPYIVITLFLGLLGYVIVPPLIQQIRSFIDSLPNLIQNIQQMFSGLLERFGLGSGGSTTSISNEIRKLIPSIGTLIRLPITIVTAIGDLLIIVVASILMLYERDRIARWIANFLPNDMNDPFLTVSRQSIHKVGHYVLGQLVIMAVVGVGTGLVMFILGLPFALPMGLLGFVGEIIPYLGPIVAGVPAAIIGFVQSPLDGFVMGGWLILLHILEAYVLGPQIQHRVLRISPLAVVLVVVLGLSLLGVLGGLVAIPFLAIVDILLNNVIFPWRRRQRARTA